MTHQGMSSETTIDVFRERLARALQYRNVSAKALGRAAGLGETVVRDILQGHTADVKLGTVERLARALGVSVSDLLPDAFGRSASNVPQGQLTAKEADQGEIVQIQKLDLSLSMGPGTLIDDWVESEPVAFDLAFIKVITRSPPNCLKLVAGIGDSMYPTLNWGDAILVDTTDKQLSKQDGIYWINLYGAAGIKRLRAVGPGRVLVKSDNPGVDDQEVDAADLRIEGRAIWFARGL